MMKQSAQLYDEGLEQYPRGGVIRANVALAAVLAAGTISCWLVNPWFGLAYLVVSSLLVYGLLRRLVCTCCYYYGRRCGTGWGQLAAMCFKRGRLEEFSKSPGLKLAPVVYGLITLVPLVALGVMLVQHATTTLAILLAFLLAMSFYSSGPGRRLACSRCKMRLVCPGNAAR